MDYGNRERLTMERIRPMPPEYAKLPPQVIACGLSKVICQNNYCVLFNLGLVKPRKMFKLTKVALFDTLRNFRLLKLAFQKKVNKRELCCLQLIVLNVKPNSLIDTY